VIFLKGLDNLHGSVYYIEKNSKIRIEREIQDMAEYGLSPKTVRDVHLEAGGLFLSLM